MHVAQRRDIIEARAINQDQRTIGSSEVNRAANSYEAEMTRVGLEPTTYGLKVRCSTD